MEKGNKMGNVTTRITTDKQVPGFWRVTLNHPPINTVDDQMYDEIFDLVEAIEAEPSLKVVTFESANPDYFLAHYGVGESTSRFGNPRARRRCPPRQLRTAGNELGGERPACGLCRTGRWRRTELCRYSCLGAP
jgi:enoyl-CoA hydratase/carnithine racemase